MTLLLIVLLVALIALLIVLAVDLRLRLDRFAGDIVGRMDKAAADIPARLEALEKALERMERATREELVRNRAESAQLQLQAREELSSGLKKTNDSLLAGLLQLTQTNVQKLDAVRETVETRLDKVRAAVEERLARMQLENNKNLEQMRQTVDEKLQGTLEKRLGESFKLVTERLEQVHKGLGEMQSLAAGVGDLKRVLNNVKTRGVLGEVQLQSLLEDVLTPAQYETNVSVRNNQERVEFAIRLPGAGGRHDEPVLLPIDAKFPLEDYQRLVQAQEAGDADAVQATARQLESRLGQCARDIHQKYIHPPVTTDFAILFLPTEALFAEVMRRPGLAEQLQRQYRVTVAGPTTLWAILTSLQMGFRTLAIEKRSSEVWELLSKVKSEFGKFGEALDKVQKNLQTATNSIEDIASRKRIMEKALKTVQTLPNGAELTPESPPALPAAQ